MREFIKKHHILMKLLSLLIAIILWVVVINADNPRKTLEFQNLPVELLEQDTLLTRYGLVVSEIDTETVSVKVGGNFKTLGSVSAENIKVRADLSTYTEPGTYRLSYDVSAPIGITVEERTPERIPVVLEKIVEKELPVQVVYEGVLPTGISFSEVELEPSTVWVSGVSSVMERADHAVVTVNVSGLNDDYSAAHDYVIEDESGNTVQSSYTNFIDKSVNVSIPVFMTKTVPVEVSVIPSAGVPRTSVATVYEPSEVTVYGRVSDVRGLRAFNVGEIDVRDFVLTCTRTFPLTLPENVDFYEDVVETVDVYVYFRDVETTVFTVNDITLENVPEDVNLELLTNSLDVTVRSNKDSLKNLTTDKIKVTVDLADLDLSAGRRIVPANVKINIGGYDVCGTYTVMVNILEEEPEEGR